MTKTSFPILMITCRTLGLSTDQTAAVLDATCADTAATARVEEASLDAAWKEGYRERAENDDVRQEYLDLIEKLNKDISERNKSIKKHNAWIDRIQRDHDRLTDHTAAVKEAEARINAEREDLRRRRAELEDPNARHCDFCERVLPRSKRKDARFCSTNCRVAACRARQESTATDFSND